ncbi:FadR/GntR family transcriptional regulator [uncultured Acinetobacter sp.]|uniref:FadR/GntR family transcriptional regulator n=1 Tax=uncultured Acinetobacter sp. TaxID=165433 RepID=UPI0028D71735
MKDLNYYVKFKNNIRRESVRRQVSEKLIQMIQSGLLQVGDDLPSERELAALFEISRESVRAALQTLAAKGLVEIHHGMKTKIVSRELNNPTKLDTLELWSEHTMKHVNEAREQVEAIIIQNAAHLISSQDLNKLQRLLDGQKKLFDDPVRFQVSDRLFHTIIYQAGKNPILAEFAAELYSYALEFRRQALKRDGAIEQSYHDHCRVLAALKNRDPIAAQQAMMSHINKVKQTTVMEMEHNAIAV